MKKEQGPRINEQIRVPEVRLLGDDGHQYGIVSIDQAMRIAQETAMDLVEISPDASPPVVKLIDYGKYKYMVQKKANEAKKKQVVIAIKELQFRPNIEKHDLEVKLRKAHGFIEDGDKLKLVMQFRGREMAYQQAGMEKFKGIIASVVEFGGVVESEPKLMGNRIICMIAAAKK